MQTSQQTFKFVWPLLRVGYFSSKERCLSLISVANLVASFSPKNVWGFCQMHWLPSPSLGYIPILMVNCIIPTGFSWILCKSNPQQHQNKQAEKSQDIAVSGLRQCQADTPWIFLLGPKWWVIFCNAMKSEWEYSSSFVQPSPSKFLLLSQIYLPHPHSQHCYYVEVAT